MERGTPRAAKILLGAIFVSALGLCWLGLSTYDAAETRARLQAREVLSAAIRSVGEATRAVLAEADEAAERDDQARERSPLHAEVFRATAEGSLLVSDLERFRAVAPPPEDDARAVVGFLHETEREESAGADPLLLAKVLEQVLDNYSHPDLTAVLFARIADLFFAGGRPDRAVFLLRRIVDDLPFARDLAGAPLAPSAHLRLISIPAATAEERILFARRLANRAWGLPVLERNLLLETTAAELPGGRLPADVAVRASLVDALEARVLPDLAAAGREEGRWRHEARAIGDRLQVLGWRPRRNGGRQFAIGYLLDDRELRRRLDLVVSGLRAESGAQVRILLPGDPRDAPAAHGLSEEGDLGGPLHFVRTSASLLEEESYAGLKALHIGTTVLFTVGLLTGLFLSLRAARREVRVARIRKNLVDDVSHELRTPLTSIRMYAEMLDEEELPDEKRESYTAWIRGESERLSRLVDDVLDLSRLEREEGALATEPARPEALVDDAVALVAPGAREREIRIAVDVPPDLPGVRAAREPAVRALANLLANAVKYSEGPGEVGVTGRSDGRRVRLTVWDRGPGIDESSREQIFERFYRAPRDARRVGGFGLGLVLAREIARATGGDVILESTSAEGSRFALLLPAAEGQGG